MFKTILVNCIFTLPDKLKPEVYVIVFIVLCHH